MKNQPKTDTKETKDEELEPWETRISLGSYLKRLSKGGAKHVPDVEKAGLDPSQGQLDG
jgi:hypothetical protein